MELKLHVAFNLVKLHCIDLACFSAQFYWWLVELPMWLTDGFLVTFFGRWKGAVRIHVSHVHTRESRTANVQGGGGQFRRAEHRKTQKVRKT